LDCSLVSNNNWGGMLPSNGLGLGPDEVGPKGLKQQLHLWRHSQKKQNTEPKIFFSIAGAKTSQFF